MSELTYHLKSKACQLEARALLEHVKTGAVLPHMSTITNSSASSLLSFICIAL